ncbi:MAG: TonB-dependent receptor domain-containing protein [Myxococcaceae bacterium]
MRLEAALLALLCATPFPAFADNTADEADVAFNQGNEAWGKRDYERALGAYFLSYRLAPNANVLFNIARCYEALERYNEAYRYYADLSSLQVADADRREIEAAMGRIRPKAALVRVTTEPPGADIFVDREDLGSRGRSPQTLALPPGRHLIRVKGSGQKSAEATVTVAKGREVSQAFKLELIVGSVELAGTPPGAWVKEAPDGPTLGTVPATLSFPPGKRIFYLGAPGHQTTQLLVDVKADVTQRFPVALIAKSVATGKVIVTANRDNALVRVDGKEAGFSPTVLLLTAGEHELEVSLRELRTFTTRVTVQEDQELRVHAELRYAPPPVSAASKSLVSVDEAPASITVISAEEIRAFGYTTLAEALAGVRGLFLSDDRIYTNLGIRGFAPPGDYNNRVLILWDGHSMNDVWAGQGYAARDLSVDLAEVERIEVVRGPGSALYGTGAFFAVINVVPRSSLGDHNVEATGAVGALSSWRGHLAAGAGSGDRKSFLGSASAWGMGGAETTDLGAPEGRVLGLDGERVYNGSARARLGDFTFAAQLNDRVKQVPTAPFGAGVNLAGTRAHDARAFAELRYDHDLSPGAVSARLYYDAMRYRGFWVRAEATGTEPADLLSDSGEADWVGGEVRARLRIFGDNHLTAGAEAQAQLRIDQDVEGGAQTERLPTQRRTLLSAYLLDEWKLGSRAMVSAGLRVDKYLDLDDLPVTPRLAFILRPYERGLTKLVAGTAFRAPNTNELYYADGVLQRAAPDLVAETIATFELEHSHDLTDELRLTVAGYHNRINNLIALGSDPPEVRQCGAPAGTESCLVMQNAPGLLRAFGGEAGLRWQPGRFTLLDVTYSYVHLIGFEELSSAPAHLVAGRLLIPLGDTGVRFATQATYQSPRYVAGQARDEAAGEALLLNFGISGEAGRLRYLAMVSNALDTRYSLPGGDEIAASAVPQYGRTFLLQVSASY